MLLKRGLGFIALGTLLSSTVWAADVNLSDLDKAVRSSTSNSIMFKRVSFGGQTEKSCLRLEILVG